MSLTTVSLVARPAAVEAGPAGATAAGRPDELIDVHARAGVLIAELSPGPGQGAASAIVVRLIGEVERVLGVAIRPVGLEAPAVVQCRELALAQRRMVAALDRGEAIATESALVRGRALLAELAELASRHRATLHR